MWIKNQISYKSDKPRHNFRRIDLAVSGLSLRGSKHDSTIMQFWYVDDGDETAATLFEQHFSNFYQPDFKPIMAYNSRHFTQSLVQLHPDLFE